MANMSPEAPECAPAPAPASPAPPQQCILPAVLRDRPGAGRAGPGRGAPPPVPPRSPRRPADGASTSRGGQSVAMLAYN